jgi:dTDP-4-dehydrorhamnose reductase
MDTKKLLICGASGFLGSHFMRVLKDKQPSNPFIDISSEEFAFDLKKPDISEWKISWDHFDYAIISAGLTNVAYCEKHPQESYQCNVTGTMALASQLLERNVIPILFSSDYVFDGKKGMYKEEDQKNPLNRYGEQKAILEETIDTVTNGNHLILRLTKVFSVEGTKSFVHAMYDQLKNRETILAATDQIFSPINVDDVLRSVFYLMKRDKRGLYNLSGDEKLSRFQLAKKIQKELGLPENIIKAIKLSDLGESLQRPLNTTLSRHKFDQIKDFSFGSLSSSIPNIINT